MFNFQLAAGYKLLPSAAIALRVFRNSLLLSTKAVLFTNSIPWIVVGVATLVAGLVLLVKNWDTVKGTAVGAQDWITQKWTEFRNTI